MDNFIELAKANGNVVYTMNQSNTAPIREAGPWGDVQSGYCAGMACRWIALRLVEDGFQYDEATRRLTTPPHQAIRDQNVISKVAARNWLDYARAGLGIYGLQIFTGLKREFSGYLSALDIASTVGGPNALYYVQLFTPDYTHAVAIENDSNNIYRLFDANYGSFKAKGLSDFRILLYNWLNGTSYYDLYSKIGIVRVVPLSSLPGSWQNLKDKLAAA